MGLTFLFFQCFDYAILSDHPGKNSVNLAEDPLNIISHFSLAAFKVLCLCMQFPFYVFGVNFFHLSYWSSLRFLDVRCMFLSNLRSLGHYFNTFSAPFFLSFLLQSPSCTCWYTWWCSTGFWGSVHFFFLIGPQHR